MVKLIETKNEFDGLLNDPSNKDKLIVVDFYADWCGPCKMIAPKIVAMSEDLSGVVVFVKVNVDENEETSEAEGISAMPTFFFYKNGKKLDEVVGANETKIKEMVEKYK